MYIKEKKQVFSKQELTHSVRIWNYAGISLIDIRHSIISPQDPILCYRLPASTFLYTSGGKMEIALDDFPYQIEGFGVFHSCKGVKLSIRPINGRIEYYMVLYKAGEPAFHKREFSKLLEHVNPFRQQYGFMPCNPLFFADHMQKMYERWKAPSPLSQFYGKTVFYQLVYEIYEELDKESIRVFEPDVVMMAKRYLNENYGKTVMIQEMCDMLGVSYSHFHRKFKRSTGKSPQEYLIKTRLEAAKKWLKESDASIYQVADYCGFPDEYNFYRTFMKNFGLTPGKYREKLSVSERDCNIENKIPFSYNETSQVSVDELKREGENYMFKQMKSKTIVAAALSMMLLLSACSAASENVNNTGASQAQVTTTQETEETQPVGEETRIIETMLGNVEIPKNPKRIIVSQFQGDFLELGIKPVGTSFNDDAVFEDELSDTTVIDAWEPNYEEVASLEPDLIIWIMEDHYEKLSSIAPTVIMPYYEWDYAERLRFFGDLVNDSEAAEKLIEDYHEKIESSKKVLSDAGIMDKTISLFEIRSDGVMRIFGNDYGRGGEIIYTQLGLKAPERIQNEVLDKEGVSFIDISYETLQDYAGDFIFSNENIENMKGNSVWETLEAIKDGHLVQVEEGMFWFSDIQSFNAQLDVIVNGLIDSVSE